MSCYSSHRPGRNENWIYTCHFVHVKLHIRNAVRAFALTSAKYLLIIGKQNTAATALEALEMVITWSRIACDDRLFELTVN